MVEDRTKRYANPPKMPKKNGGGEANPEERTAKSEAEATAGKGMPTPRDPDKIGKVGEDKGPDGGGDPPMTVAATVMTRHKQEHSGMLKRHGQEQASMVDRHGKEAKEMHGRHAKELADHFEQGAEGLLEKTAGSPEMLGRTKSEAGATGHDGAEP